MLKKVSFILVLMSAGSVWAQVLTFRAEQIDLSPDVVNEVHCIQVGIFMETANLGDNQSWQQFTVNLNYTDDDQILAANPLVIGSSFLGVNVGIETGLSAPGTPLPFSLCAAKSVINSVTLGGAPADFMPGADDDNNGSAGIPVQSVIAATGRITVGHLDVTDLFITDDGVEYLVAIIEFTTIANPPEGSAIDLKFAAGLGQNIINRTGDEVIDANGNTINGHVRIGGTGNDTIGLFDPVASAFFLKNSFTGGTADHAFGFGPGAAGYTPLSGDWDNSGNDSIGLYRPVSGTFYLKNSFSGGAADTTFNFGPPGLMPLTGDWDANGVDSGGVYDPAIGRFFLKNSFSGGVADVAFNFGPTGLGWVPLTGDWNADGTDTVGLYDPANGRFYLKNSFAGGSADVTFRFGPAGLGWVPLVGDWNGNGTDTIGLYDPNSGNFYLRNSFAGGDADEIFRFGPSGAGWLSISGDWDGP